MAFHINPGSWFRRIHFGQFSETADAEDSFAGGIDLRGIMFVLMLQSPFVPFQETALSGVKAGEIPLGHSSHVPIHSGILVLVL